jgi:tRNA(His) 5'-end guanylyltransferase
MRMEDRFKDYEAIAGTTLPRHAYTIVRVDGRAFHTYTKGFTEPFSRVLADAIDASAQALCEEISGSIFAYTQSDEISVLFADISPDSQPWFGGNVQKIVSVTSSIVTAVFNRKIDELTLGETKKLAHFDSRVFTVPNQSEATNYFLWRQRDAVRNSISMAARAFLSHNQVQERKVDELRQMLKEQGGFDWDECWTRFRRGGVVRKHEGEGEVTYTDKRTGEEQTIVAARSWWATHPADAFEHSTLSEMLFSPRALEPA